MHDVITLKPWIDQQPVLVGVTPLEVEVARVMSARLGHAVGTRDGTDDGGPRVFRLSWAVGSGTLHIPIWVRSGDSAEGVTDKFVEFIRRAG